MKNNPLFKKSDLHNIINYIYEYGSYSFKDMPFNEVDSLVLSCVTYFPVENFYQQGDYFKKKTLQELCVDYLAWINIDYVNEKFPEWMTKSICLAMAILNTERFSTIKVVAFEEHKSDDERSQYGSFAMVLDDSTLAITFRGTDDSMIGWKENLDMIYLPVIRGQNSAVDFLQKVLDEYPRKKFRTMGHSKGGNLALYSCIFLREDQRERCIEIYSHDGPGVNQDVEIFQGFENIKDKCKLTMVKDDLVAILFHNVPPYKIVKASYDGPAVYAHDPYSWIVEGDRFISMPDITPESKYISKCINEWVDGNYASTKERKLFVDAFFFMEAKTGFSQPSDILKDPFKFLNLFMKNYSATDKEEKRVMNKVVITLIRLFVQNNPYYLEEKRRYTKLLKGEKSDEIKEK